MGGKRSVLVMVWLMLVGIGAVMFCSPSKALTYIALGDSFTSGEGETSDNYYQFKSNASALLCHNSVRSYPYIAALQVSIPLEVHNVACSGAQTLDIVGGDDYFGQGDRLAKDRNPESIQAVSSAQIEALHSFAPGITRQMIFIDHYKPDFVTIGIGGNDIGMVDKLKICMMPGTCDWASDRNIDARIQAAREIRSLFDVLVASYNYLVSRSPHTRFFAVGYPKIINPDIPCTTSETLLFDSQETIFMDRAIDYLNSVVASAARTSGLGFIEQGDAFRNHALCDLTNTPAMNGMRIGDDIAPFSVLSTLKLFGNESFHPTPFGHFLLAQSVASAINRAIDDGLTNNQSQTDQPEVAPPPPEYWHDNGKSLPREVHAPNMTTDTSQNDKLVLVLPSRSLQPGTQVEVLIHSTITKLATVMVDSEGGLRQAITLPNNLDTGFHTVIVKGLDAYGEQVEYYKVIQYVAHPKEPPPIVSSLPYSHSDPPSDTSLRTNGYAAQNGAVLGGLVSYHETQEPFTLKVKPPEYTVKGIIVLLSIVFVAIMGILYKFRKWT